MRRMLSISSARAPSPASAIATSPEARNSRNASADTVTPTRTARPKRLVAKASMSRDSLLVTHLPEARNFIGMRIKDKILGRCEIHRQRIHWQGVGAPLNQRQRLRIGLLADSRVDRGIAALQ